MSSLYPLQWFHAKTSLWHLFRPTSSTVSGTWAECLERIDNEVTFHPDPIFTVRTGTGGRRFKRWPSRVCSKCQYFYTEVLNAPPDDDEVREKLGEDYL